MLTIPHAMTGLVLATIIPQPLIGLPIALASHFAFDFLLPHWNPSLYTEKRDQNHLSKSTLALIMVDGIGAGLVTLYFSIYLSQRVVSVFLYLITASLMTILPDLIKIPYYFLNYKSNWLIKYIKLERKYQSRSNKFWGILSQVMVCVLCLWFYFSV